MNNRFQILLTNTKPERKPERKSERKPERKRHYLKAKDIEQQMLINNEVNFPSLQCDNKVNISEQIEVISHVSILKNEEETEINKLKDKKLKKGWIQLGEGKKPEPEQEKQTKEEGLNEYLYFVDSMVNLYEQQKLEKIEILEEENYERYYKFPNYDYNYFDKLDEKYQDELEAEMKQYNNDLYGYNSDNST